MTGRPMEAAGQAEEGRSLLLDVLAANIAVNAMAAEDRARRTGLQPPLGLQEVIQQLEAGGKVKPALVVEGEKAWEAARRLCGERYACFTWMGEVEKSDWRLLDGFPAVYIWPNNAPASRAAAKKIAQILKTYPPAKVFIVNPPENAGAGWNLADAEAEGLAVL